MKTNNLILALIFIVLTLSACTERIEINTEDAPVHLSIYGYITADTTQHSIRIVRSNGFFASTKPEGISNAIVSINTDENTYLLTENSSDPGLYQTEADVFGIPGKTYTMNVSLDFDNDGKQEQYQASSILPYNLILDSIALVPSTSEDDHIDVLAYGTLPKNTGNNTFSFHVYNNGVIVNDSLTGFSMVNDEFLKTTSIKGVSCASLNQGKDADRREIIKPGNEISLRIDVFTKEYGTFIQDAQAEVNGSMPFFSGPPANVVTNIKSLNPSKKIPIVGYFSAYSGQMKSTIAK